MPAPLPANGPAPTWTAGYRERPSRFDGAVVWTSPGTTRVTRVLPDGCMDLIWNEARQTLYVAGPDTRARDVQAPPDAGWAGLRLAPGVAPALLGVPAHELRDRLVALDAVLTGSEARRLTGRVASAAQAELALEDVAGRLASRARAPDPLCQELVAGLRAGRPVAALATSVGLSERQLRRRSLVSFGYGPATLARVLRLQRALRLVSAGTPFAQVAVDAGYADQAHLTRDVKALTGLPPGRLRGPS